MVAYLTKFVLVTIAKYLIFVKNDEIPAILVENGSLYNRIYIKPIETLKGNHYNGFKIVLVSSSAKKSIVVDPNAKVLMNLISKMPFHSVVTIKSIPPDPRKDPPKPAKGDMVTYVQHILPNSRPFRR
jgi:hypothetical protein